MSADWDYPPRLRKGDRILLTGDGECLVLDVNFSRALVKPVAKVKRIGKTKMGKSWTMWVERKPYSISPDSEVPIIKRDKRRKAAR